MQLKLLNEIMLRCSWSWRSSVDAQVDEVDGQVHVRGLPGESLAPGCIMGGSTGRVIIWDFFFRKKWSCYWEHTTQPPHLAFLQVVCIIFMKESSCLASFSRIMHRAHSKNDLVIGYDGWRAQQHIWSVNLAFNTPHITNLCVRQTPLFLGWILRDLEDLPTS